MTDTVFYGEKEDIKRFREKLLSVKNQDFKIETDFGKQWLGFVLKTFGINWKDVYCRGAITEITELYENDYGTHFFVKSDDAWGPRYEVWNAVLEKIEEPIKMEIFAEEPGCGVYINTDTEGKFFDEKYYIDFLADSDEEVKRICEGKNDEYVEFVKENLYSNWFSDFEGVKDFVNKLTGKKLDTVEKIEEMLEKFSKKYDTRINFYEYSHETN
jgi:hypothetical protein